MHWQWCGTESTVKTNYACWRGFSTLLYSPWQRAVHWGWKGPSSHQTAPNKERGPAAVQLMHTQGMCISSTHCHTLLPCFGDGCPNTMLLYTQSLFTQLAASQCYGVFLDYQDLKEKCLSTGGGCAFAVVAPKTLEGAASACKVGPKLPVFTS